MYSVLCTPVYLPDSVLCYALGILLCISDSVMCLAGSMSCLLYLFPPVVYDTAGVRIWLYWEVQYAEVRLSSYANLTVTVTVTVSCVVCPPVLPDSVLLCIEQGHLLPIVVLQGPDLAWAQMLPSLRLGRRTRGRFPQQSRGQTDWLSLRWLPPTTPCRPAVRPQTSLGEPPKIQVQTKGIWLVLSD